MCIFFPWKLNGFQHKKPTLFPCPSWPVFRVWFREKQNHYESDSMQLWELEEQPLPLHLVLSIKSLEVSGGRKANCEREQGSMRKNWTHVSITTSSFVVMGNLQKKPVSFTQSCIRTGLRIQKSSRRTPLRTGRATARCQCTCTKSASGSLTMQASSPPASNPALTLRE